MDDLSYFEQMMGGGEQPASAGNTGGIWVVSPDGALDDGILRLVGKARVVADALGAYVYLLLAGSSTGDPQAAVRGGADEVLLAQGVPAVTDLVEFFTPRQPQAILFPRTTAGRTLGPGLAQLLGGSLCGYAVDMAVDPAYQRLVAQQPVLDDIARQRVALLNAPAILVVDTQALPAAFGEPWRSGQVTETGLAWAPPAEFGPAELRLAAITLANAEVVVAAGRGLRSAEGAALAQRLAHALGGVMAGDLGALDAGWIDEEHLVGLTGHSTAPRVYLALGIDGDTEHLAAVQGAGTVVAVQADPSAPITHFADWNVIADPGEFAAALLARLAP